MAKKDIPFTPLFSNKESLNIESAFVDISSAHQYFKEVIERTPSNLVSNNRKEITTRLVNYAKMVLLAFDKEGQQLKLDTKSQRRILEMMDQVAQGKREAVQFQLTRDCDAIKEVFSNEVLKLHESNKK